MFVILCTQIFPVSSQLPLGQVPQTLTECTYLSAVLVLCQGPREHEDPVADGNHVLGLVYVCAGRQIQSWLSFSKERIHFNVTLVNAHYRNEMKTT